MARAALATQTPVVAGLTVAFTTMSTGSGNGLQINPALPVRLKNPTGGTATFTVITPGAPGGNAIADLSFTLATTAEKTYDFSEPVYKNTDGLVYIDCDVAAQAAQVDEV